MSERYTDLSHTLFPDAMDDEAGHPYMSDVTSDTTLMEAANRYSAAISSNNPILARQILSSAPNLQNCLFNADKYNWMRDAIIATQKYYHDDVRDHITTLAANTIGIDDTNEFNSPDTNSYSITKINGLVNGTSTNVVLAQGSWIGSTAPFQYVVPIEGVTASNNVDVSLSTTATVDQSKLWAKAMCLNADQAVGRITLRAYGKKPTGDIPITVTVHK